MMNPDNRERKEDDELSRFITSLVSAKSCLSLREAEILYYVIKAQTNKDIGARLNISEKTVKNHLNSVYGKLNVHNRLQLINKLNSFIKNFF